MAGKKVSQLTPYAVLRESDEIVINDNSTPPITKKTSLKELSDFVLAGLPPGSNEVTQISAGTNITVNPTTGKGNVTINAIDTGLTDLVLDLTPQLGGELDLNGFNIAGNGDIRCTGFASVNDNYMRLGPGTNTNYTIQFPVPSGAAYQIVNTFGDSGLEFRGAYSGGGEFRRDVFLGTSGNPSQFRNVEPIDASQNSLGSDTKKWGNVHTEKMFVNSTLQLSPYYSALGVPTGSKIEFDSTGNNCIYSDSNSGPTTSTLNIEGYSPSIKGDWQMALYADNNNDGSSAWIQLNRTSNRIEFYTNGVERSYIENDRMHLHHLLQLMSIGSLPTDGRSGDMCNVGGDLYFHTGSAWKQVYLYGDGETPAPPGDVDWDNVIMRMTYDTDFDFITSYSELPAAKTPIGSPVIDTNNQQFGTGSAFFGNNNAYNYNFNSFVSIPYDFTFEFWWRMSSNQAEFGGDILDLVVEDTSNNMILKVDSNKTLLIEVGGATLQNTPSQLLDNQFNHIALTRDASGMRIYINGALQSTSTSYTDSLNISQIAVGNGGSGWMDDFRFTKDCRYTLDFAPPTEALPISN